MRPARTDPCPIACASPNANPGVANRNSPTKRNSVAFHYPCANVGTHDHTYAHPSADTDTSAHSNADGYPYPNGYCHPNADGCTYPDQYPRGACGLSVDATPNYRVSRRA